MSEALSDAHTAAREMVVSLRHPAAGEVKTLGIPFRMAGTPASIRRPPPTLGQHTDEVLQHELGYTAERISALRREGVV